MKYLLSLLTLLPLTAFSQSLPELITRYEKECATLVPDTIDQTGEITYKVVPVVGANGKIVKYTLGSSDTTWQKVECPEFKYENRIRWVISSGIGYNIGSDGKISFLDRVPEHVTEYKEQTTRKHVCMVKIRQPEPFSEDFWNWAKRQ